ncbi:MAG: permease prefix domain 1-containing protein [SAR202 cluster bacterium]|nr:permease prefix domain 1-containing protein [SAR202 cluster bacterium]
MASDYRGYLSLLERRLHLEPGERDEIVNELHAHVQDRVLERIEQGQSPEAALKETVESLGAARELAEGFYEIHSRGSWHHTALAVIPHLLLALTYAFHLWTNPMWVGAMLLIAISASVVGWRKGRPRWAYPWLGYSLIAPIVSWGLAMSAVGYGAWGVLISGKLPLGVPIYIASFVYFAFSLWVVIKYVSRVARPDWVMASLAILPVPFLAYWFFFFYNWGFTVEDNARQLREVDSSAAVIFLIIAAATAVFYRIGRRLVRVALLAITAPSLIVLAWMSYQGGRGYVAVFLFAVMSMAILLSPALFDLKDPEDESEQRILGVAASGLADIPE